MTDTRRTFISYRRSDSAAHAGWLADTLRRADVGEVFLDVDTVGLGENFVRRIQREIERCDVVLVMIGRDWLATEPPDELPRIFDELDWVHLEIKSALERDIPVVPVLVEGARMPRPPQVPENIRELCYRSGIELRESTWPSDVGRLIAALPSSPKAPSEATSRRQRAPRARNPTQPAHDTVVVAAKAAYQVYLESSAYICQPDRGFRPVTRMGFYTGREIKREIPTILHRRDGVILTRENAAALRARGDVFDEDIARTIELNWTESSVLYGARPEGAPFQFFVLSAPDDPQTIRLPVPLAHTGFTWTMGQRYVGSADLQAAKGTTEGL